MGLLLLFAPASQVTGTAGLSGSGSLATVGAPTASALASLSGGGSLAAAAVPSPAALVVLGGSGALTTTGAPAIDPTVALAGTGALTTAVVPAAHGSALLTGSGLLALAGELTADPPVVSDPHPTIGGGAAPVTHHAPRAWRSRTEFADDDLELLVSGALSLDEWLVLTASEGP